MEKYNITITREFGSLGRPIAHALSQKLGIEYYDRDIVDEVAKQLNLPVSQISDAEESSHNHFFAHMFPLGTDKQYIQDMIFAAASLWDAAQISFYRMNRMSSISLSTRRIRRGWKTVFTRWRCPRKTQSGPS